MQLKFRDFLQPFLQLHLLWNLLNISFYVRYRDLKTFCLARIILIYYFRYLNLMIIIPEYDANWHQKCTFFPLTLEDKTTDLDTVIFVLAVGNRIHYGVQVEFWSNLTIFRCDDPSKIDKFAIF